MESIRLKIDSGQRLSKEDGLKLLRSSEILQMAELACAEKQRKTGDRVFFNVNCHVNLTNVCVSRCGFCAFSCDVDSPSAYVMNADDVNKKISEAMSTGITEVHMVSGLHPGLPFSYYLDNVKNIKDNFPEIHIKAFTPVEIQYFSEISGLTAEEVLSMLIDAGLGSMPGGGAEVLSERVRKQLCPAKATSEQWLSIMKTAHRLGLKSNATILYGHIETMEELIDHLLSIRDLQDETGGFQTFIPLPFHPVNTGLQSVSKVSAMEQLRMFSVCRLMLDNFDHIKAYWIMTGLKTAQISLYFGVDDIDGTVVEEKITHAAGADTAVGVTKQELTALIKQTGNVPVQRDTMYNVLGVY